MSKLIYFKRYLYVIDRLRSRPCSFIELQEHVMHKLEQDDIDTTLNTPYEPFATRKTLRPFGIVIQYNRKDKTYYWWRWNRRPVDTRMIDFSIHHALQEGNKLSPSVFLEKRKIIRNRTYLWYYSCHTKSVSLEFTHRKHWEDCSTRSKTHAIKESQQRWYLLWIKRTTVKPLTGPHHRFKITDTKFKPIS
jgi:hypothetical protein